MLAFRLLLLTVVVVVGVYTVPVAVDDGVGALFPTFFGHIAAAHWPGQFNLDFFCFLIFSGTWIAWRHHFSSGGIALGIDGLFLGAPYLSVYLLVEASRAGDDVAALLVGPERAAGLRAG